MKLLVRELYLRYLDGRNEKHSLSIITLKKVSDTYSIEDIHKFEKEAQGTLYISEPLILTEKSDGLWVNDTRNII